MDELLAPPALPASLFSRGWRGRRARRLGGLWASALDAYIVQSYVNVDALERASSQRHTGVRRRDSIALQQAHLINVEQRRLTALVSQAAQLHGALAVEGEVPLFFPRLSIGAMALLGIVALGMTAQTMLVSESPHVQAQPLATPSVDALAAAPLPTPTLAGPRASVLERERVVAVYGHPAAPVTGILGKYTPEGAALEAVRLARLHEAASGVPTRGALHVTAGLAHPFPGSDGTYLEYLDASTIDEYVAAAQRHGLLLILDTQIGWGDPLEQARHFERYLNEPFVHLALDPEFATRSLGLAPGSAIGTLDATLINAVQRYLADLVRPTTMPAKMLIVHQFRADMLSGAARIEAVPDVDLVIDMDGFGTPEAKLEGFEVFSLATYADQPAIKLFVEWDTPLMLPAQIEALPVPPRLVIYQ